MIRTASATLAVLALTASAAPALAQSASAPTRLSGVTVTAPSPTLPMVVSTWPENGKAVSGGVVILKVTFDQKMNPDGWDYGKGDGAYPKCLDRPRLLPDEKTFVLLCTADLGGHFSVTFNRGAAGGFENTAGQKATPTTLDFTTDDKTAVASIADALKVAGLKSDQGPVMDDRPSALAQAAP